MSEAGETQSCDKLAVAPLPRAIGQHASPRASRNILGVLDSPVHHFATRIKPTWDMQDGEGEKHFMKASCRSWQ